MDKMTWTCKDGRHGTAERVNEWTFTGKCTGYVKTEMGESFPCECECHNA